MSVVEAVEQRVGVGLDRGGDRRVEVRAAAGPDHLDRGFDAAGAVEDLARLGDVRDPRGEGDRVARQLAGHALAVPPRVRLLDAGPHVGPSPSRSASSPAAAQ